MKVQIQKSPMRKNIFRLLLCNRGTLRQMDVPQLYSCMDAFEHGPGSGDKLKNLNCSLEECKGVETQASRLSAWPKSQPSRGGGTFRGGEQVQTVRAQVTSQERTPTQSKQKFFSFFCEISLFLGLPRIAHWRFLNVYQQTPPLSAWQLRQTAFLTHSELLIFSSRLSPFLLHFLHI